MPGAEFSALRTLTALANLRNDSGAFIHQAHEWIAASGPCVGRTLRARIHEPVIQEIRIVPCCNGARNVAGPRTRAVTTTKSVVSK